MLLPGVLAVLRPQHFTAHHVEGLAEPVLHLALPLEGQIGGCDDQRPRDEASNLEVLEQQPRHDRLARAGVVGKQKPNARQRQEIVVDRYQLVR